MFLDLAIEFRTQVHEFSILFEVELDSQLRIKGRVDAIRKSIRQFVLKSGGPAQLKRQ